MKKTLAIVLALAMVLCMIPAAFADTVTTERVETNSYNLTLYKTTDGGVDPDTDKIDFAPNTNTLDADYNYQDLEDVITGKWSPDAKMAILEIKSFNANQHELTNVEVTVDGKKVYVNDLASYIESTGWWMDDATHAIQVNIPLELTKAGYTDTFLIEVTGEYEGTNNNTVEYTEVAKITVRLENTAEYKTSKTATIASIRTNSNRLDAYTVGDRFYLDFAEETLGNVPSDEIITITFKDNNGKLFDVDTWAYTNATFAAVDGDGVMQIDDDKHITDGWKLSDSKARYKVRSCTGANDDTVSFTLENGSAIYETKEYTVVVREGIEETDPQGIYFAEATKTIAVGEEYVPVVLGVATNRKVDAGLEPGTGTDEEVIDFKDTDDDGILDAIIGTKEGVAYITASYTPNYTPTPYETNAMKIVVTTGKVDDDDATDGASYIVTASSLRVRSGAGTNFSQIGSLKNGATVKVESIANGWAKLENGGYVSAQYLAKVVDNGEAQTMYVTARTLNVRKGPGTSYAKAGTLSRGTAVQVVGFSGNWAKLSNGYYVSTSYLAK